jgi:hypothetical protein
MFKFKSVIVLALGAMFMFASCSSDDEVITPVDETYEVPTVYNFDNVSYSGQTQRLAMMSEMSSLMKSAVSADVTLDVNQLLAMYSNDSDNAGWAGTYSKQLKNKTFELVQADFETLLNEMAEISSASGEYEAGSAGVVTKNDGSKSYLVNGKGVEPVQLIEKGLMGACFYYQATSVYLGEGKMNVDNTIVEEGEGTEMEHHWDEGFGYLGAPIDFPTNTNDLFFWAKYSNTCNEYTDNNQALMDAFLLGRAAISNDDLDSRDAAIVTVRNVWENVSAAAAIHYLNDAAESFDDVAIRLHTLSEALAFIYSLQFNDGKTRTNDEINAHLTNLATTSDITAFDLTGITSETILSVRDALATEYGLDAVKENL